MNTSNAVTPVAIEVRGLTRRFGRVTALDRLDLSFEAGLLHGIIGSDGAGKTTLLRVIDGLLKPDSGGVSFYAGEREIPFSTVRPGMAYMPAGASLYPDLSIQEHLEFFRRLYRLDDAAYRSLSDELYEVTRLGKFRDRKVGQLSGGMYKKVGLMCALLRSPSVMLLDEPTNGVDPISRREFWELLYRLADRGILILITTAYMDEAERCARVHLLDSGHLLAGGRPDELLRREGVSGFDELFMRGGKR